MMKLIVCVDKNNAIGKDGELGFRLPSDLRNFKKLTTGNIIVYGSKTLQSMGGKPLPKRKNIVHTFDINKIAGFIRQGIDVETPLSLINKYYLEKDIYICGGGQIYKEYLKNWSNFITGITITVVDAEIKDADTFFPYDLVKWERFTQVSKEDYVENGISYSIYDYEI